MGRVPLERFTLLSWCQRDSSGWLATQKAHTVVLIPPSMISLMLTLELSAADVMKVKGIAVDNELDTEVGRSAAG